MPWMCKSLSVAKTSLIRAVSPVRREATLSTMVDKVGQHRKNFPHVGN